MDLGSPSNLLAKHQLRPLRALWLLMPHQQPPRWSQALQHLLALVPLHHFQPLDVPIAFHS